MRESLLNELEEKHYSEQDKLYELMELTTPAQLLHTNSHKEHAETMDLVNIKRNKVKETVKKFLETHPDVAAMTDDEKKEYEKVKRKR